MTNVELSRKSQIDFWLTLNGLLSTVYNENPQFLISITTTSLSTLPHDLSSTYLFVYKNLYAMVELSIPQLAHWIFSKMILKNHI